VSICSGEGDILGVLADRRGHLAVTAALVELDPANTIETDRRGREAGLGRIEIVTRAGLVTDT
jgi:hypothetical protein